jgi:hypothetical protein
LHLLFLALLLLLLLLLQDTSMGMRRVEITCSTCGGHLGHVGDPATVHLHVAPGALHAVVVVWFAQRQHTTSSSNNHLSLLRCEQTGMSCTLTSSSE